MTEYERIDADPDARSGDTRVRVEVGEHGTFEIVRERYTLVAFPGPSDDIEYERYDWTPDARFVLANDHEAKQVAAMLHEEGAFDPVVAFFQQLHPEVRNLLEPGEQHELVEMVDPETLDDESYVRYHELCEKLVSDDG